MFIAKQASARNDMLTYMICGNCIFWRVDQDVDEIPAGECRRFPRSLYPVGEEWKWLYPTQFRDDSCGEFKKVKV